MELTLYLSGQGKVKIEVFSVRVLLILMDDLVIETAQRVKQALLYTKL